MNFVRCRLICRGDGTREEPLAIGPSQSALFGFRNDRTVRKSLPAFRIRGASSLLSGVRSAVPFQAQQLRAPIAGFSLARARGSHSSARAALPLPEPPLPAPSIHWTHRGHSVVSSPNQSVGGDRTRGRLCGRRAAGCTSIRTKALSRRTSWSQCFAAPLGSQRGGGPKL